MPQQHFEFKQFTIKQDRCAMKVGTDAVLLGAWVDTGNSEKILDIGSGTGILALMLAQKSNAQIDGIDIDENAFLQASENVNNCLWRDRINIFHISLQEFAIDQKAAYSLIVSNPPYFIDSSKANAESRTAARHTDSLSFQELISCVETMLSYDGRFCVILPTKEAEIFVQLACSKSFNLTKILRVKTRAEKSEKRCLMQFERIPVKLDDKSIVIEVGDRHEYSEDYKQLTKDYYLAF